MDALRGGVRPSKDTESQLWDEVELSRDSGGQGPSWWRIFGGEECHEKGEKVWSHLQPGRLRPRSGPDFIAIETFVIESIAKSNTSASGVNDSLVWCAGVIEKNIGEISKT